MITRIQIVNAGDYHRRVIVATKLVGPVHQCLAGSLWLVPAEETGDLIVFYESMEAIGAEEQCIPVL